MYNSLDYLMKKFPYFLDKREGSNFHDTIDIFNTDFKKLRQLLYEMDNSWSIMCPVLIKRVQVEDFLAVYSFLNYLEHPKRVTIYREDEVVFTKYYPYKSKSKVDTIIHTLMDTSESKLNTTLYKMVIETHDEYNYTITTETRNPKLDYIGKFIKCPRRTYNQVDETDYQYTVPTYVSGGSEDDYNYIERMKQYLQYRWKKPLPELYLWQKYNITNKMINRHHQIFRIASETFNNESCGRIAVYDLENGHVFSLFNTLKPIMDHDITINSYLLNNHGEQITKSKLGVFIKTQEDTNYLFKGNTPLTLKIKDKYNTNFHVITGYVGEDLPINTPLPDDVLISNDEVITPRNENNGDLYVSPDGNDNNDGRSKTSPLKTIQKAINIALEDDLIVIMEGTYILTEAVIINKSCIIIGESENVEISNVVTNEWIHLNPTYKGSTLSLKRIKLTSNHRNYIYKSFTDYTNMGNTKLIISGVEY